MGVGMPLTRRWLWVVVVVALAAVADDVLLRITTASDEFKIISVGPIRPNQVTNGVTNGRFVPIGGAG